MFPVKYKIILLLFILPVISYNCNGQQKNKNDEMQELLDRELKNQENAKQGNKDPEVQIISDRQKVEDLRKVIIEKIAKKKKEEAKEAAKNKTLWQRYKNNDKTVVSELIRLLRGSDAKKRAAIYDGLARKYDDPETYNITENELVEQLLHGIENREDEKEAVQLAGLNKLPGYYTRLESRLLSGQSTDQGRIFYWLSDEAKSRKPLDYIGVLLKEKKINGKELDEVISGLESFGKNGDEEIKKTVGDLALLIYREKLITEERIEELRNSAYTSDAAESLLICIFNYSDNRAIPVANDILKRKIRIVGPVKALLRLEGVKHMEKVYAYLRNENDFFTGLEIAESMDRKFVNDNLLKEIMISFAQQKDIPDYTIDRIVRSFTGLKAEAYLENPGKIISNKIVADRIKKAYDLSKISFDEILNDLLSLKLIREKPGNAIIEKLSKEAEGEPGSFIYGILENEKVYHYFDAETGFVPADYDNLLLEFASKSKGVLKDMIVWMDAKENKDGETFQYTITVISNNKAFIAKPEDIGDWYDVVTVNTILEKVLADLNSRERFVSIDTGDQTVHYIFGDPANVNQLAKKYKL
jgi:hypothetical protein